ncbi:putative FAD binding domain-containing protein [Rosellinia necatrix]|uniref:Putative FAD binding domain-containing protein n=1 Tax=Rosellinia necatrix TaxID=77044 RepID=A0A1W2TGF3_ROSNE|nr:putative FAD binding domain-containing protein [Rosellinia necatrix]
MGFKVIIVGGSVSGLSLANMLERFDIDYLLLEAYPKIAPQLGASIGLLPGGLRILDQLGCYEPIRDMAGDCYYQTSMRQFDGRVRADKKPITFSEQLESRVGYPQIFIDRQMLLQVLYNNLKFKDRVLIQKRATRVDTFENHICVHTQDGSTYNGDIIVGADGIHSVVRTEMWRNANEAGSDSFGPDEESELQCDSKCIFGISKRPAGLPATALQINAFFDGWNYMMLSAPGDRLYWFLFHKMEKARGKDIPRFSKDDEAQLAGKHLGDLVTETTTFGHIYENRVCSTLVPIEEHVFARWHFGRIMIIGDAAHKVHPITAQGGNGAMETAAVLVNELRRKLGPDSRNGGLSEAEIESIFTDVQAGRFNRAWDAVKQGRRTNSLSTRNTLLARLFVHHFFPRFGDRLIMKLVINNFRASPLIENLAVPQRCIISPSHNRAGYAINGWGLWTYGAFGAGFLALLFYCVKG